MKTYLYGITDDKFVRASFKKVIPKLKYGLEDYRYHTPEILRNREEFDRNDISIVFKVSPESLLNLAARIVDAFPLQRVYTWTIEDVCRWLRQTMKLPQYQRTFRDNFVNGRTLLLVDATALCAMNVKDFDHIRQITKGIRELYYFEITKFGRSISLAPEFHLELYKLLRVKNGTKYETMRRSELWQRMGLLREKTKYLEHWDILAKWLRIEPEHKEPEIFGTLHHVNAYESIPAKEFEVLHHEHIDCNCMPPCECYWKKRHLRMPWRISGLAYIAKRRVRNSVLPLLQDIFPEKYGNLLKNFHDSDRRSYSQKKRQSTTFIFKRLSMDIHH